MQVRSVLGGFSLGLWCVWANACGQVPDLPPLPPGLGTSTAVPNRPVQRPAPTASGAVPGRPSQVPAVPGRATPPTSGSPAATTPRAGASAAAVPPAQPVPPLPGQPAGVAPPFGGTEGMFSSAMAGSPAVTSFSNANASLFGEGPAVSSGLLSTRRLTSGPDFQMIGDQAPAVLHQAAVPGLPQPFPPGTPPPPPSPRLASAIVPSVRGFKIAENQSPQPQDRVFFTFNYFSDLNGVSTAGSSRRSIISPAIAIFSASRKPSTRVTARSGRGCRWTS